ncbi:uricase-like [Penaeus monodon]|uniref:uricase-like n=1 Tax=Penaeus monodon TaxID=6687 RepID=UPI0018A71BAE|nr:uricase-like [Penaeus monodon]
MDENFEWVHRGYGKNNVKLLHLRREGPVHTVKEYEVNTALTLDSDKDYIVGDNSDIIATDSQKNTVYILAKNHGVKSPEDFALLLCSHFLSKYSHVTSVKVDVEEYPWRRLVTEGKAHNHAFLFSPEVLHTCSVSEDRGGQPHVWTGLQGMRVLKTTQSSFTNFVSDEFRSLPDMEDRLFSTVVAASWKYADVKDIDFGKIWIKMQKIIYDKFAGPPDYGIYSPSVQNTVFLIQDTALKEIPQLTQVKVTMPNKHYFGVDLSKFPEVGTTKNNEVFLPVDKPAGNITSTLGRKLQSKL